VQVFKRLAWIFWRFHRIRRRVEKDPDGASYRDIATTPVTSEELESLEPYQVTPAAQTAVIKVQRKAKAAAQVAAFANWAERQVVSAGLALGECKPDIVRITTDRSKAGAAGFWGGCGG
jgi:hypothetical protein